MPADVRLNPDVRAAAHRHDDHNHTHGGPTLDVHRHVEAEPPTEPSRAVVMNVGEHTGALVLSSDERRSGIEVEIHPVSEPSRRTHVWVLAREGRDATVYAAVFPSLRTGDYVVLAPDGSTATVVTVPPNMVTNARLSS